MPWNTLAARGLGSVQKSPSSKAAAVLTRGAYTLYVSTAKGRERRWRLFSTDPISSIWCILMATMAYSIDWRKRVVEFVEEGGSKAEAAPRFRVSLWCVKDWCRRGALALKRHGPRRRKLDRLALRQHVAHHPEDTLKERAQPFGVQINAIWYALRQLQVPHGAVE